MIKIERKVTEKAEAAKKALEEAKSRKSTCNTKEVNEALQDTFCGKCYICESKDAASFQIEHLVPHKGNDDLKYDWNNLFWACAHCNNTKLASYDPILDCTREPVDELIAFRKEGYFGIEEKWIFEALEERQEVNNTVQLLEAVYYGTTPQKKIEAKILRRKLRIELSKFKEYVREYEEAEDYEKEGLLCQIKKELKASSSFTAFKRWIIRDNRKHYPELAELIYVS